MKILMVTPAPPRSRAGNRTTAARWARLLRRLGHRVVIAGEYTGGAWDAMIALHAWRSAAAIATFRARHRESALVVALTGTDLYQYIHSHPATTLRSIELADRLVVLHALAFEALPAWAHPRIHVIYQSAEPLPGPRRPSQRAFDVCVVGHLRQVKDPLRAALAARRLEAASRIRVRHYGKAGDADWAEAAREEMRRNSRYRWLGDRPHWQVRRVYARCRALILSSRMEGGANVISEAIVAGLPVIASDIAGSRGLLGRDYPGCYPVEDTSALQAQLQRVENDPDFLEALACHCERLRPLFTPTREARAWQRLLAPIGA